MYKAVVLTLTLSALPVMATSSNTGFQLFDFASSVLEQEYINPRGFDITKTVALYETELRKACPRQPDCPIDEVRKVVRQMFASLGDAHLAFFNINDTDVSLVGDQNDSGRFGLFLERGNDKLYVRDVYPESPAARAGVRTGDVLVAVNQKTGTPAMLERALRNLEMSFSEAQLELQRQGRKLAMSMRASFTSPLAPVVDQLDADTYRVRVYALGQFFYDQTVHSLVRQLNEAKAKNVVLDLRFNEGGTSIASMKVAAAFVEPPERLLVSKNGARYIMRYANGEVDWRNANDPAEKGVYEGKVERPQRFQGKVAVLTSERTYSAGEHLAYILQDTKRAIVLGKATAGAMDTSATYKWFENKEDGVYYGDRGYQTMSGKWFPPRVVPDVAVADSISGYERGRDNTLDAAIQSLNEK
jgi:carboxyl-terminal processing protease